MNPLSSRVEALRDRIRRACEACGRSVDAVELPELRFVLIGPLQRNKAKPALEHFQEIMTLDRPELALRLGHLAGELGLARRVWMQVDLWGEATKLGGCP